MVTHMDLFSGIGGFALAAREVWGDEYHNVCFCDNNKFCQAVIRKNFGQGSVIIDDIRDLSPGRLATYGDGHGHGFTGNKEIQPAEAGKQAQRDAERRGGVVADTTGKRSGTRRPKREGQQGSATPVVASGGINSYTKHLRKLQPQGSEQNKRGRACDGIDLLTGGFPCQPFSQAGKRRGKGDDRFLWPEMLRVIKEFKPRWIIGENVAGILSMVQFKSDLEMGGAVDVGEEGEGTEYADGIIWDIVNDIKSIGYDVQCFVIPACAVNAPHRRDRIWIVAHSRHGDGQGAEKRGKSKGQIFGAENAPEHKRPNSDAGEKLIGNPPGIGRHIGKRDRKGGHIQGSAIGPDEENKQERDRRLNGVGKRSGDAPDSTGKRRDDRSTRQQQTQGSQALLGRCDTGTPDWNRPWLEVAYETCTGNGLLDDGLPKRVYPIEGKDLTEAGHRVERLKALGNAIVPQVAIEIMRAIKEVDNDYPSRP